MNAPIRVTANRFNELVDEFLNDSCFPMGDPAKEKFSCIYCGSEIEWKRVYMSIHTAPNNICSGEGDTVHPNVPVCVLCEPFINVFGCIHAEESVEEHIPFHKKVLKYLFR